jgi:hypothetical protein
MKISVVTRSGLARINGAIGEQRGALLKLAYDYSGSSQHKQEFEQMKVIASLIRDAEVALADFIASQR